MPGPTASGPERTALTTDRYNRLKAFLLLSLFALYFCLGLSGYGNDNDTYGMLKTWSDLFQHGLYSPSRPPGYPLPEVAIGAMAQMGGWAASNALSALLACGCLACFLRLVRARFGSGAALASAAAAGLNPHFIIAASSSMDYVYAACFCLAGVAALASRRVFASGILFALCAASRLTYLPLIALAYIAAAFSLPGPSWSAPRLRGLAIAFVSSLILIFAAYLPAWISMGAAMFRPTLSDAPVSLLGLDGFSTFSAYAARFVYKNVSLWGLPACVCLAAAAGSAWFGRRKRPEGVDPAGSRLGRAIPWAAVLGILYAEALFFRLPLEINYLLPVLFLGIFLVNGASQAPVFLVLIALCHALQGVAQVEFIEKIYARKSYESVEASGGRLRLHFARGVVREDLGARKESQRHYFQSILGDSTSIRTDGGF